MLTPSETVGLLRLRDELSAPENSGLAQAVDGLLAGYQPSLTPSERQQRLRLALQQGRDRLAWMKLMCDNSATNSEDYSASSDLLADSSAANRVNASLLKVALSLPLDC